MRQAVQETQSAMGNDAEGQQRMQHDLAACFDWVLLLCRIESVLSVGRMELQAVG